MNRPEQVLKRLINQHTKGIRQVNTIELTTEELFSLHRVIDEWHYALSHEDRNRPSTLAKAEKFDRIYRKITTELHKRGEVEA